ncbi:MAG: hypothetical protein ACRD8Z_16185 [Nitrososphaeraceae archaeon]
MPTTSTMSRRTAKEHAIRLNSFRKFVLVYYGEHITIDNLIVKVKEESESPYSVLNNYAVYLLKGNNVSNLTLKQWIVTVKNFLEYHDVDISPRKFKVLIKLYRLQTHPPSFASPDELVNSAVCMLSLYHRL